MSTPHDSIPQPDLARYFGSPVIDWSKPFRDPWVQLEPFEYIPLDANGNLIEPDHEIYDTYDKALAAWMTSWAFIYRQVDGHVVKTDKPVPFVFATPDRAFAQIAKVLCPGKKINFDEPGATKVIPLPFGSIDMSGDPTFDAPRWNNRTVRYGGLSYDNTEMLQYRYPIPINIVYQVSLWAKTKVELDAYTADFVRQFRSQELFWLVTHGQGFGVRCVPVYWDAITQAVDLEPGGGQRSLRRVFQLRVDGWIPNTPYSVKTVLRLDYAFVTTPDIVSDPGGAGEVVTVIDVTDQTTPGGGPDGTRHLDGPFPGGSVDTEA